VKFNILDEILLHIFKRYSYKIYKCGMQDGFNWNGDFPTFPLFSHSSSKLTKNKQN
jgi:hypothetical protein